MKIAICDDSIEDLLKIEKLLLKYRELNSRVDFEVEKYSDALLLYHRIQEKNAADIYILDMLMTGKTGIDIGLEVRKLGRESEIIYITSSDDFALDAYGVHAARYLLKPIHESGLFEALGYAISCVRAREEAVFLIKTRDGLASAGYSQIEYIESSSRTLVAHLAGGEQIRSIFIRKSFDEEIKNLVTDQSFARVHKSFVINLKYVRKLTQSDVVMESGRRVPVSKSRMADVKKEYISFVLERYG